LNPLLFPLLGSQMFGNVLALLCLRCQKERKKEKKKVHFVRLFLFVGFSDSISAMALIWLLCAFVAPFIVFCWYSLGLYKCHSMVFFVHWFSKLFYSRTWWRICFIVPIGVEYLVPNITVATTTSCCRSVSFIASIGFEGLVVLFVWVLCSGRSPFFGLFIWV